MSYNKKFSRQLATLNKTESVSVSIKAKNDAA